MNKTAVEHISATIVDIKRLIDLKEDFYAFIIISLGIEFLGSFKDGYPITESGHSESRFKNGLEFFKKDKYKKEKQKFYKSFRCPLVHQLWTGDEFLLTSFCKNKVPIKNHLMIYDNKTILVIEVLFDDFKEAVKRFKNMVSKDNNSFNKEKLNNIFSEIIILNINNDNYESSGSTITKLT